MKLTNRQFSEQDQGFIRACEKANKKECERLNISIDSLTGEYQRNIVTPNQRQASKFRQKKGLAYKIGRM